MIRLIRNLPGAATTAFVAAALCLLAPCLATDAMAADPGRGKALYETRCNACHNSSVHQSTSRRASSFEEIRRQVARWGSQLGTSWDSGDVDDISVYLNNRYYKLPCPPATCPGRIGALEKP